MAVTRTSEANIKDTLSKGNWQISVGILLMVLGLLGIVMGFVDIDSDIYLLLIFVGSLMLGFSIFPVIFGSRNRRAVKLFPTYEPILLRDPNHSIHRLAGKVSGDFAKVNMYVFLMVR